MNQTQYNTINNRESKLDILTLVSPSQTPMFASLPRHTRIRNEVFEYFADSLQKPNRRTIADGKDVSFFDNKAKNRVMIQNRVQIMNRPWIVSRGQEKDADPAGVKDEIARARMVSSIELKTDIESVIGSMQIAEFVDGDQGCHTRGFLSFADPDNSDIPASVRATAASKASTQTLSETNFRKVIQAIFEENGNPDGDFTLFAQPELQNKITGFSRVSDETDGILRSVRYAGEEEIKCAVRIYRSDWGVVTVVPDLFLGLPENGVATADSRKSGVLLSKKTVALSFNEDLWNQDYPDLGGGKRGAVWAKFATIAKNPKAMGSFA